MRSTTGVAAQLGPLAERFHRSETSGPVLLAVLVGLLAGAANILLRRLIALFQWLFQDLPGDLLPGWARSFWWLPEPHMLVAPAVGLLIVVFFFTRNRPEAAGSGVPEVQYAVRVRGGRIPPSLLFWKSMATAISIGSGGSVGREGPIVQLGSTLGSWVGQVLGMNADQLRLLVACGAAGAVGATFNAPIAGVMFAMEVILASFAARAFGLVVISSVTATALSRAYLGQAPAFTIPEGFVLVSEFEFGLYLVLGIVSGLVAMLFKRVYLGTQDFFAAWDAGIGTKAVTGGLLVGALGTLAYTVGGPALFDVGNEGVELALSGELALWAMLLMVVLKMGATSLTLAAGGSGGIFAPSLFIGSMLGGAFGALVHGLFPSWTAPAGAYGLVGMAALWGAALHAPITAILILFEMTDEYRIILPLMFCVVVAYLVAVRISDESIYTAKLRRRGGLNPEGADWSVLDLVLVADTMDDRVETVSPDRTLAELEELARHRRTRSWPVSPDGSTLVGIVTDTDLERALLDGEDPQRRVEDIMTRAVVTCAPGETIRAAFRRFTERDVQLIPVVEGGGGGGGRLVGVLRRHDMLWAYREMSQEHDALLRKVGRRAPPVGTETVQVEYEVPEGDHRVGHRRVREIPVPAHTLIALIRRAGRAEIPRGDTRIEPGDVVVFLTTREHEGEIHALLSGSTPNPNAETT